MKKTHRLLIHLAYALTILYLAFYVIQQEDVFVFMVMVLLGQAALDLVLLSKKGES